jgi:sialidase-1
MLRGTVTKNDSVWQGHPDVAYFNDELFVIFRESDRHMTRSKTKIQLVIKSKNKSFSEPVTIATTEHRFNCPRLSAVDDHLWIICDEVQRSSGYIKAENDPSKTKIFLWKSEDGRNWSEAIGTNITGIVPDRICSTDDGYLIATHTMIHNDSPGNSDNDFLSGYAQAQALGSLGQNVWHSTNLEHSWTQHPLCHFPERNLCEASITRFGDTYICLMRENSGLGLPAHVCHSNDGINWSPPKLTRMFGCHRPTTGVLQSGNLLTTYREASHSFKPGYWAKNTFACLTHHRSALVDFMESIILPLDHDRSKHSDSGYTGWVQLPDDSIYIVNYTTGDAPRPYIRWYQIHEDDF